MEKNRSISLYYIRKCVTSQWLNHLNASLKFFRKVGEKLSIYERIELLIKNAGMTKKAFCLELGISTGNLGDWKRGKSTPSTNKLIEIAAFFNVSLDWLMTGREKQAEYVQDQSA